MKRSSVTIYFADQLQTWYSILTVTPSKMWTFHYKYKIFGANTIFIVLFYLILYNVVIIEGQRNAKRKKSYYLEVEYFQRISFTNWNCETRNIPFYFSGFKRKGGKCKRMCNVMESGSKTMRECKFPFIFKGQTFESCTDYKVTQWWIENTCSRFESLIAGLNTSYLYQTRYFIFN